jgi:hypothetical protein
LSLTFRTRLHLSLCCIACAHLPPCESISALARLASPLCAGTALLEAFSPSAINTRTLVNRGVFWQHKSKVQVPSGQNLPAAHERRHAICTYIPTTRARELQFLLPSLPPCLSECAEVLAKPRMKTHTCPTVNWRDGCHRVFGLDGANNERFRGLPRSKSLDWQPPSFIQLKSLKNCDKTLSPNLMHK